MIDVNVTINSVVLCCDDSVLGIHIGNGYSFVKTYIDNLPFKDKITNGSGQFTIPYFNSIKTDKQGKYFLCLKKNDCYQIENLTKNRRFRIGENIPGQEQMDIYNGRQSELVYKMFSLLHLFKAGNIGISQLLFEHKFYLGNPPNNFIENNYNIISHNATTNIVDERVFSLTTAEIQSCNQFLMDYAGNEYALLKDCIDEFVWGLEQVDLATGFEQFTTALEMMLLEHNQKGKKEVLSKRVAVMLESTPVDINQLYGKMKVFYRYRSESLHDGNGQNISEIELYELEELVRQILVKCLEWCKRELVMNPSVTWSKIKRKIINDLQVKVTAENNARTFKS